MTVHAWALLGILLPQADTPLSVLGVCIGGSFSLALSPTHDVILNSPLYPKAQGYRKDSKSYKLLFHGLLGHFIFF